MLSARLKSLIANTGLLFIGNLGVKLISFFMVPFFTFVLTKREYGTIDLITTTVTMLTPVVTLSVFDAIFRFTMDSEADNNEYFTNGIFITCIGSLLTILISFIIYWIRPSAIVIPVGIMIALNAIVSFLLNFAKGIGKLKLFTLAGLIFASLNAILNVYFLKFLHLALMGYLEASIISTIITIFVLFFMGGGLRYIDLSRASISTTKEMIRYSAPLIPNAFAWWFTTDSSRFLILFFLGATSNGLYAVATKIPAMLTVLFSVFNQAWQISAIEEGDAEDRDSYYSTVYNTLINLSFIGVTILSLLSPLIMRYFVSPAYYEAWKLTPLLLLSVTFSNLSGILGTSYIVFKKTRGIFWTTLVGMTLNVFFALILIPLIGLNGAGLSSAMGFFFVMVIRLRDLKSLVDIQVNKLLLANNMVGFMIATWILISIPEARGLAICMGVYLVICNTLGLFFLQRTNKS